MEKGSAVLCCNFRMRPLHALLALCLYTNGITVNISNVEPRRDVLNQLMDVHDGNIIRVDSTYYYYGMGYLNCTEETGIIPPFNCPGIYQAFGACGFRLDHAVNIYSSKDLVSWTYEGDALPQASRPSGVYFRPKVIYNANTNEYVLWVNVLAADKGPTPLKAYPHAVYMVGVSRTPTGPFSIVNTNASVAASGGGDFTLMVDSASGDAFIAYDAWSDGHAVRIERLTPDFRDSLGAAQGTGPISPKNNEAPIMFERFGVYYLLFGHTCCFCSGGAGSAVYVASHPLGPWNYTIELNPSEQLGSRHVIKAQENYVFAVRGPDGNDTYIYTGDRWASAPDHKKSHDFQYWQPLKFDDTRQPPLPEPLKWVDSFVLSLA